MRIIAAATLVFLPSTFVATLFSASFWNFGPANRDLIVSKWIWGYWVLTFSLTAVVIGIWRGLPPAQTTIRRIVAAEKDEEKDI